MAQVFSFAEEVCWDRDKLRTEFPPVVFQLTWAADHKTWSQDFEFVADFGLWYDPQDDRTLEVLNIAAPGIRWEAMIFHKKLDHSGIDVIDAMEDEVIATITVRRGETSGEIGGNVVLLSAYKGLKNGDQ